MALYSTPPEARMPDLTDAELAALLGVSEDDLVCAPDWFPVFARELLGS